MAITKKQIQPVTNLMSIETSWPTVVTSWEVLFAGGHGFFWVGVEGGVYFLKVFGIKILFWWLLPLCFVLI